MDRNDFFIAVVLILILILIVLMPSETLQEGDNVSSKNVSEDNNISSDNITKIGNPWYVDVATYGAAIK